VEASFQGYTNPRIVGVLGTVLIGIALSLDGPIFCEKLYGKARQGGGWKARQHCCSIQETPTHSFRNTHHIHQRNDAGEMAGQHQSHPSCGGDDDQLVASFLEMSGTGQTSCSPIFPSPLRYVERRPPFQTNSYDLFVCLPTKPGSGLHEAFSRFT
jgi:hypothetical protein